MVAVQGQDEAGQFRGIRQEPCRRGAALSRPQIKVLRSVPGTRDVKLDDPGLPGLFAEALRVLREARRSTRLEDGHGFTRSQLEKPGRSFR